MTITELRRRRGHLYLLVIDGEPAVTVDINIFEESPYQVGSSLSDEELKALLEESQRRRAKEKAYYLLSLRDHSRLELEKKLRREADEETAAETATRMEELGLINDQEYAEKLSRDLSARKHYPKRRILQELCARGVDREMAQAAVEKLDSDDIQQALALIKKKYYNKLNDNLSRQKTAAALARFGFNGDSIRKAMDEWQSIEQDKNEYGY